jgi:hypothetical protein
MIEQPNVPPKKLITSASKTTVIVENITAVGTTGPFTMPSDGILQITSAAVTTCAVNVYLASSIVSSRAGVSGTLIESVPVAKGQTVTLRIDGVAASVVNLRHIAYV